MKEKEEEGGRDGWRYILETLRRCELTQLVKAFFCTLSYSPVVMREGGREGEREREGGREIDRERERERERDRLPQKKKKREKERKRVAQNVL